MSGVDAEIMGDTGVGLVVRDKGETFRHRMAVGVEVQDCLIPTLEADGGHHKRPTHQGAKPLWRQILRFA